MLLIIQTNFDDMKIAFKSLKLNIKLYLSVQRYA